MGVEPLVFTVRVAVCALVSVMSTDAGLRPQLGAFEPDGLTEQLRLTVPVKPPVGVTVIVEFPLLPGAEMEMLPLLLTSSPGTVTLAVTAVVEEMAPDVPVTVTR